MVKTVIHANIPLPVSQVFQHVSQLENMVEYNGSILSSEVKSGQEGGLPVYLIDVDIGIKKFKGEYKVSEFIPNEKIVASCTLSDMKFTDTYIFREENGGTYFEITDVTELKGLLSLSEFLLGPIMKTQMNGNLKSLLKILLPQEG